MKHYINKNWEALLAHNNLNDFDELWNLDIGWFEEPNDRRGGWSGVSRLEIQDDSGQSHGFYLKRQQNHNTRTWRHWLQGEPTFAREFRNIQLFITHDISTVEPVYFCWRIHKGQNQAILMTKELEGFNSLDAPCYARESSIMQDRSQRESIMAAIAEQMRKMHQKRFRHNCFYSKHVFIKLGSQGWEVRFIDLEKLSRSLTVERAMLRDLYTFPRRISGWRKVDRLQFLKIYLQEDKRSEKVKSVWRQINARMKSKNKFILSETDQDL